MVHTVQKQIQRILIILTLALGMSVYGALAVPAQTQALPTQVVAVANCDNQDCIYKRYINPLVKLLSAAAGVVTVLALVVGGVQYSASDGDPQKIAAAKGLMIKAVIGF